MQGFTLVYCARRSRINSAARVSVASAVLSLFSSPSLSLTPSALSVSEPPHLSLSRLSRPGACDPPHLSLSRLSRAAVPPRFRFPVGCSMCFPCLWCLVCSLSSVSVRSVRLSVCAVVYFRPVSVVDSQTKGQQTPSGRLIFQKPC